MNTAVNPLPLQTKQKTSKLHLFIVTVGIILTAVYVANYFWRISGDGSWQYVGEDKGVTVFSKKTHGDAMLDFRGVVKVKSSVSALVALFMDPDSCPEWMPGCAVGTLVQPFDPKRLNYIHSYIMTLPAPFKKREAILETRFAQDPATGQVTIRFIAKPEKLPPNDCCLRVTHVNNTWRFTPIGNGEVEVSLETDADFGGNIPVIMVNLGSPSNLYGFLSSLQKFADREKYKNATYEFIKEVATSK